MNAIWICFFFLFLLRCLLVVSARRFFVCSVSLVLDVADFVRARAVERVLLNTKCMRIRATDRRKCALTVRLAFRQSGCSAETVGVRLHFARRCHHRAEVPKLLERKYNRIDEESKRSKRTVVNRDLHTQSVWCLMYVFNSWQCLCVYFFIIFGSLARETDTNAVLFGSLR